MSSERGLRVELERLLADQPGQSARQLSVKLHEQGVGADKSRVNSVLYRHSDVFRHDGSVPPRWSLAEAAQNARGRTPNRVAGIMARNWKVFETVDILLDGVTLLYGENSSGKSSLIQALLLLKQSWGTGEFRFEGPYGSFARYAHVVHGHDTEREVSLIAMSVAPAGSADHWGIGMMPAMDERWMHGEVQPIRAFGIATGDDVISMRATEFLPQIAEHWPHAWIADHARVGDNPPQDEGDSSGLHRIIVFGSNDQNFPDVDDVLFIDSDQEGSPTPEAARALATIRRILDGATKTFDGLQHIGPSRTMPQRDIELSWAKENAPYLATLYQEPTVLAEVNHWLSRFEIPYTLEVDPYGDDLFDLNLTRVGEGGERVQLRDVGFGVSQLLPIITQLVGNREKTILIEEPEAHVHPRLQSVLGDLFMTSLHDYGNVLVVETHSEPILLRLQRRIAEGELDLDEFSVFHVVRRGRASDVEAVAIQSNGQLDYTWPGGFFDDRMDDLVAILDPRPE